MEKPQPTFPRKALRALARTALVVAVFTGVFLAYAAYKASWAKKQVESFNQQVVVGMSVADLEMKAGEMRLRHRRMSGSDDKNGSFSAWQGFAFNRWFCEVEYRDGKAVTKRVTFLD